MFKFSVLVISLLAMPVACGSSSNSTDTEKSSLDGGGGGPLCTTVCSKLASLCGQEVGPNCESECGSGTTPSQRSCVLASASCEAAAACLKEDSSPGGKDAGRDSEPPGPACDGTKFCKDDDNAAICENDVTRVTSCKGKKCAAGRCGYCTSASDCTGITYRCKCADGTEKTGTTNTACGDSQGSQMWCSPPSIGESVCQANGGADTSFGYLGGGCVSSVDP